VLVQKRQDFLSDLLVHFADTTPSAALGLAPDQDLLREVRDVCAHGCSQLGLHQGSGRLMAVKPGRDSLV